MNPDIKDVLIELDSKITEVYDLNLAEEMTDIYMDLTDRINEFSSQYWRLVKVLARIEKERDDLHQELEKEKITSMSKSESNKVCFDTAKKMLEEESKIQDKLYIEREQAEYDRDYYRNELDKEHASKLS